MKTVFFLGLLLIILTSCGGSGGNVNIYNQSGGQNSMNTKDTTISNSGTELNASIDIKYNTIRVKIELVLKKLTKDWIITDDKKNDSIMVYRYFSTHLGKIEDIYKKAIVDRTFKFEEELKKKVKLLTDILYLYCKKEFALLYFQVEN